MKTLVGLFKYPFEHVLYITFSVCFAGFIMWLLKIDTIYLVMAILMSMWLELLKISDKLKDK